MIPLRRKMSIFDLYLLRNGNCLALALKFDSKSVIKDIYNRKIKNGSYRTQSSSRRRYDGRKTR